MKTPHPAILCEQVDISRALGLRRLFCHCGYFGFIEFLRYVNYPFWYHQICNYIGNVYEESGDD